MPHSLSLVSRFADAASSSLDCILSTELGFHLTPSPNPGDLPTLTKLSKLIEAEADKGDFRKYLTDSKWTPQRIVQDLNKRISVEGRQLIRRFTASLINGRIIGGFFCHYAKKHSPSAFRSSRSYKRGLTGAVRPAEQAVASYRLALDVLEEGKRQWAYESQGTRVRPSQNSFLTLRAHLGRRAGQRLLSDCRSRRQGCSHECADVSPQCLSELKLTGISTSAEALMRGHKQAKTDEERRDFPLDEIEELADSLLEVRSRSPLGVSLSSLTLIRLLGQDELPESYYTRQAGIFRTGFQFCCLLLCVVASSLTLPLLSSSHAGRLTPVSLTLPPTAPRSPSETSSQASPTSSTLTSLARQTTGTMRPRPPCRSTGIRSGTFCGRACGCKSRSDQLSYTHADDLRDRRLLTGGSTIKEVRERAAEAKRVDDFATRFCPRPLPLSLCSHVAADAPFSQSALSR